MEEKTPYVDEKARLTGFNAFLGMEFPSVSDDKCIVSLSLRPEYLNPLGVAHGGVIATLTDVAAGTMALQADHREHTILTQSCHIHFLRPGTGDRLTAESYIIRKGHRVCVVQVDCFSGDGTLSATAIYEISYLE